MENKIIIQSESFDKTTDDVVSWIHYLGKLEQIIPFLDAFSISSLTLDMSDRGINIKINDYSLVMGDVYWYRRGFFLFDTYLKSRFNSINSNLNQSFLLPIKEIIEGGIFQINLNKCKDNYIEKLQVLKECHILGVKFPATLITDNLRDVMSFLQVHKEIIAKPTKIPWGKVKEEDTTITFSTGTVKLCEEELKNKPPLFLPTLFQQYIEKKYEIRSFFINDKFFSMAIFSQANEKTKIDFRNYDDEKPNRLVPYKLPDDYEKRLTKLMHIVGLESGSIDIIYTPDNQYYFLEVNPVGQFQWLSRSCNYYIEKYIAEILTSKTNN